MSPAEKPENAGRVPIIGASLCRTPLTVRPGAIRSLPSLSMTACIPLAFRQTIRILMRSQFAEDEGYDVAVPNKTIYVSDGDLKLYQRAQELAGGNLSAAIAAALKRYVNVQEGLSEGFEDVVVRVGIGTGRKVRFIGVLVGEWVDSSTKRADHYRVWRGRTGKFVVHVERQPDWWSVD